MISKPLNDGGATRILLQNQFTENGWPPLGIMDEQYRDFMTIIEADTDPEDAFKQITNRPPGSIVSVPKKGSRCEEHGSISTI